ncbi:MAG: DNA recombination/repair protein RecA, partial [Paracoccaceae bacterium]
GQGRENAKTFLKENEAMALEIEDKIRAAHGLDFDMSFSEGQENDDVLEA